ncbi:hypothetical protein GQ53DRAFT_847880 [Thozetella sp. PMI_491]|nr:hypothetical protein GQ53DRAFT_847880 [Thozetella sp. PMI_491]
MASQAARITTWADHKNTYEAGLMSLFSGKPEETEADLQKLFTPDFTLRYADPTDPTLWDLPAFIKHIRWLRDNAGSVNLTVVQWVRTGSQLAERHTSTTTMPNGSAGNAETFQFAEVAEDGRIRWIVETVVREKTKKAKVEGESE